MTRRIAVISATRRLLPLLFGLLLCGGCLGPTGAAYDRLGIRVTPISLDGDPGQPTLLCFTLPVLLGSRVEEEYPVFDSFSLFVSATRDEVTLTTKGAVPRIERTFTTSELEVGLSDSFDVTSSSSNSFNVDVQAGCF